MLKKLSLGYTIVFVLFLLILLGEYIFEGGNSFSLSTTSLSGMGSSSAFSRFVSAFVQANIYAFITVVISSYMLHRDESRYIPRIILLGSMGYTVLYLLFYILEINSREAPEFVINYIVGPFANIMVILLLSYIFVIPLLLILLIEPDNRISSTLQKASLGSLGLSLLSGLILVLQLYAFRPKTLEAYASYEKALIINLKIFVILFFVVLITMAVAYVVNYAFEGKEPVAKIEDEEESIDYAELARQAEMHAQMRQNAAANSLQTTSAAPVQQQVAQPEQMEAINVPHVEATPTPVQAAPPVDTGLDNLIQSQPLVNENQVQNNE